MAIKVTLDRVLKENNMTSKELCKLVGITEANLAVLRKQRVCGLPRSTRYAITCTAMLETY